MKTLSGHTVPIENLSGNRLADELAENGYGTIEGFLSLQEVKAIKNVLFELKEEGGLRKAGIGTANQFQVNHSIRGDQIKWINQQDTSPAVQAYINRTKELMGYLNRTCFLSLKDFEAHYTMYPPGSFYKRHLDQLQQHDHRKISFITYLNEDWLPGDGGQLKIYATKENGHEETVEILPTAGKMVCFRSDLLEHEVLPATRNRYSLTGWMLDQVSSLTFL